MAGKKKLSCANLDGVEGGHDQACVQTTQICQEARGEDERGCRQQHPAVRHAVCYQLEYRTNAWCRAASSIPPFRSPERDPKYFVSDLHDNMRHWAHKQGSGPVGTRVQQHLRIYDTRCQYHRFAKHGDNSSDEPK